MQKLCLKLAVNGEPAEMIAMLKQLRMVGLEWARLEVWSKTPRSTRSEWLWINTIRGKDTAKAKEDLNGLARVGRVDRETEAELARLIEELASLKIWVKDDGMS